MAITKSEIFAAADRIVAEGGNPTLAAIRKALGGGSFTTISEAKKEWDEQQQTAAPAPIREAAPAAIADRMSEAAAEAWTIALEMANARLQSEREALEQVRQETERSRQEAADLADQVAADFEAAQATIAQQSAEAEKAAQAIATITDELSAEREARQVAERARDTTQAALSEAHQQVASLAASLAGERDARTAAEGEARARIAEAAKLSGTLEAVQAECARLAADLGLRARLAAIEAGHVKSAPQK